MTEKPVIPEDLSNASLRDLQHIHHQWSNYNFGDEGDGTLAFIGMIEELGEAADHIGHTAGTDPEVVRTIYMMSWLGRFAHATLKRIQGIRKNEDHVAKAAEALESIAFFSVQDGHTHVDFLLQTIAADDSEVEERELADAIGDLTIYGMEVMTRKGLDYQDELTKTCSEVFARDWRANAQNGRVEE